MTNFLFFKFKKLFKIKFRFDFPSKKKILLLDEIHAQILKEIIKVDFNVLNFRKKEIYFWIYIKQIIFFDFSFKTYCNNYISYTSPKVIVTFNDARLEIYELKNIFKKINFISIVNGIRFNNWFKEKKTFWPKNLKCDYIFLSSNHYVAQYQKIIKSHYKIIGSFKNNLIKIKNTKFHKEFLLISQAHQSPTKGINHRIMNFKKKLLKCINLYLAKKNKKIYILLRSSKSDEERYLQETSFYKEIFRDKCVFYESDNWKKKYEIIDQFGNIIFYYSTMGFEAIARKKKVAVFAPNLIDGSKFYFGWPGPSLKKYNFFSTKKVNNKEVARVLKNVLSCSQTNWNKKYYKIIKNQCYYDKNNKLIKDTILRLSMS